MSNLIEYLRGASAPRALPVLTYPGAALTGARVRDLVNDAEAQFKAQAALHERYRLPVVQTCMDLSVEAEAFGCPLMVSDDEPPTVLGRLVTSLEAVHDLSLPGAGCAGRTGVYLETVRRLKTLPGSPWVLAGMIGPFSLAGRLFGVSESLELTMEDPELLNVLLDKCTRFLTDYARAFKAAGADGLLLAEPTAGLLSPRSMATFSSPWIKRLVSAVEDDRFTLIYHNCAAKMVHLPSVLDTGARVLHFGPPMDLPGALEKLPPAIIISGNLDPSRVLVQSSPAEVVDAATALLRQAGSRANFVLSSGCDIPARAPLANVDALFEAAGAGSTELGS